MKIVAEPQSEISFTCNICGATNANRIGKFHREIPDCASCGSTPRFRGIINALSIGLFGTSLLLPEFPVRKNIRGVGMSDWEGYARILADRLTFQNTFLHMEPKLDIMGEDWRNYTDLDFVICSEVFEHVLQPLSVGLDNLRRMLKPGGVMIFSVPFTDAPHTQEHFPGMRDFATCQVRDTWIVVAKQADGRYQVYDRNVVFHGGPGTVLEMRLFGQDDLRRLFEDAGFQLRFYDQPDWGIGYVWSDVEETAGAGLMLAYVLEARPRTILPACAPSSEYAGSPEHPVVATSQRIMDHLQATEGASVSKFWRDLAVENLRMLRANGPETFKRTLSQNYFNWAVDDPAHPQMRTLLRAWADAPDRLPLQAELHGSAELESVGLTRYLTTPEAARTYTLFVGLVWWFAARSWPGDLPQRLSEPELGGPVDIRLDGRRISQDLANSLREWGRIAPSLAAAGERPLLAEIGAGYGRLGYVALQARPCRYWVFDIAPALALSQWYLTSLFPAKRVFAWRPFAQWDDVQAEATAADLAFFSIDQLALVPDLQFDVTVAISVLHEMLPPQSLRLLQAIADKTRGAVYIKNWTTWNNVWDGVLFQSDILQAPIGMAELWSRADDVISQFTEKLFCRA